MTDATDRTVAPAGASIELASVVKRYRTGTASIDAVDGVTLSVAGGAAIALTGPSGSGKSTLLHLVGAIEQADAGTITVDDTDITAVRGRQLTAHRRRTGFVFQRYHLLPTLTALDNVVAPLLPYRVPFDKTARARELLTAVGLDGRENDLPSHLSGGQQQRVAIARALIGHPRLLLADEPTGNLDSRTGADILDLLLDLRTTHGMTLLIATHEQHIAARCDRLIRLRDGRIVDDVDLTGGQPPQETLDRIEGLRL